MVLYVSRITYDEGKSSAPGTEAKPELELSDGWYCMRAAVDECLAGAVQVGRIRVGTKLKICGARLDASNDGSDVLAAYNKSSLQITGNSTCLCRWDSKLGTAKMPFVASLRSLSANGGVAALLDIVIDTVFPLAFVDSNDRQKPPWGEEEEAQRQRSWTVCSFDVSGLYS